MKIKMVKLLVTGYWSSRMKSLLWLRFGIPMYFFRAMLLSGLVTGYWFLTISWAQEGGTRLPAVSGVFYPENPQALRTMVKGFLEKVPVRSAEGEVRGLIVPHAGYKYSGGVAAFAYKLIEKNIYDSVIIIAPCHRVYFDGVSVYNLGDFETPLGKVSLDKTLADKINFFREETKLVMLSHRYEHSIEVQLPFLQVVWEKFSFVPVLMSNMSFANSQMLADVIAKAIGNKKVLVIASSDFSHYHTSRKARAMDAYTLKLIEENKIKELSRAIEEGKAELCGSGPVISLMLIMEELGADKIKMLDYANSGDVTGELDRVVGYAALSFSTAGSSKEENAGAPLDKKARSEILQIARQSLEIFLKEKRIPEIKVKEPILLEKRGVFVTLKKKGRLRGCIGNFTEQPLYLQVQEMAVQAAVSDPRFVSVREEELKDIDIEVSVLSPMKKIHSLEDIILGKHGIYVRKGNKNGCFLPQVAEETGWTKKEFLRHCFLDKAGLPADAWERGAEVFVFSAEVFSEKENN